MDAAAPVRRAACSRRAAGAARAAAGDAGLAAMSVQGTAAAPALLWAPAAWIGGRWQRRRAAARRHRRPLGRGAAPASPHRAGAEVLPGPVLPGLVNAHSHAFQRAFVGLAERRDSAHDDFWSWRDRMYGVALRITPAQLRALAAQLYAELLAGGYTQVCEFHYLQHAPDGSRYADPAAMAAGAGRRRGRGRHRPDAAAGAVRTRRLRAAGAARRPAPLRHQRRRGAGAAARRRRHGARW